MLLPVYIKLNCLFMNGYIEIKDICNCENEIVLTQIYHCLIHCHVSHIHVLSVLSRVILMS